MCMCVGSYRATKVFIGNMPATGRGWAICQLQEGGGSSLSWSAMNGGQLPTNQLHDIN